MAQPLPLEDVRVLDLTRNTAGPYGAMILAELGADVIKIEMPGTGDDTRSWGPPFWHGESAIYLSQNRNKRSIALDLKAAEARPVMERLVLSSDVLLESFRPGSIDRIGYGYGWATEVNPRVIYCTISGFGPRGPLSEQPGYDSLMQAFGGIMSVTGVQGGCPVRVGTSIIDMAAGMWSATSIIGALRTRDRSGKGSRISVSLYETALAWMNFHITGFWATGVSPTAHGSSIGSIVPYQAFATSDGYVMVAAPNDLLFARLCEALGLQDLPADKRFATNPERVANAERLVAELERETRKRSSDDLVRLLKNAGIPTTPVRDTAQVARDPQALALGIFQQGEHPHIEEFKSVGMPFEIQERRPPLRRHPPLLGEHTAEILLEIGFSQDEIAGFLMQFPLGGPRRSAGGKTHGAS